MFRINKAIELANITMIQFQQGWKIMKRRIPDKELYDMLEKAFRSPNNLAGRVVFVKEIMRRWKAIGAPVCMIDIYLDPTDNFAMQMSFILHTHRLLVALGHQMMATLPCHVGDDTSNPCSRT